MPSQNHVHKYHRRRLGASSQVWACALPNCTHYQPKHMESMVEGKQSICNQCGDEFILNVDALSEDKPRCENCRLGRDKPEDVAPVTSLLSEYLEGKVGGS